MTRKITLTIGAAVAALAVGVPTAFGEGRLAGSQEPTLAQPDPMIEDGFAQAVAAKRALGPTIVSERTPEPQWMTALRLRSEGLNRIHGLGEFAPTAGSGYKDAFERIVEPQSIKALEARSEGLNRIYGLGEYAPTNSYRDAHERAVPPTPSTPVSVTVSNRDVEWPQVGVGFGIGIVLALGLFLAMKATRQRPLAH